MCIKPPLFRGFKVPKGLESNSSSESLTNKLTVDVKHWLIHTVIVSLKEMRGTLCLS